MNSSPPAPSRRALRSLATTGALQFLTGAFGIWMVCAVISVTQTQLRTRDSHPDRSWWVHFYHQVPDWFLWALVFTPVVYWLSGRIPLRRQAPWPGVLCHALLAVVNAAVFYLLYLPLKMLVSHQPVTVAHMAGEFRDYYSERIRYDLILYGAVLGAATAYRHSRELRRKEQREARLEADLARARVAALQAQLRPHFLFNAHHSIAALARQGDTRAVESLVLRLGELLRRTLELTERREISLEEELELTTAYLDIEQVRFSDRLEVDFDVNPALLEARVPPFVLQPLVENAVKHGVGAVPGPARVTVSAAAANGSLQLKVRNWPVADASPPGTGIGLVNLRTRLAELYGGDRVQLSLGGEEGAVAQVEVPRTPEKEA